PDSRGWLALGTWETKMSSSVRPAARTGENVSRAWLTAIQHVLDGGADCSPLVLSIEVRERNLEDPEIRCAIDQTLASSELVPVKDNAAMIFPWGLWQRKKHKGREHFFKEYQERLLPRILKRSPIKYGTYFGRLIHASGLKRDGKSG